MRITRHAEERLRKRTGWPRKAIRRAVEEVASLPVAEDGRIQVVHYRGLEWRIDAAGERVVTVVPLGECRGSQEFEQFAGPSWPRGRRGRR